MHIYIYSIDDLFYKGVPQVAHQTVSDVRILVHVQHALRQGVDIEYHNYFSRCVYSG